MNIQEVESGHEPVVLVTGAARRIGAAIAECLHSAGCRIVVHCHYSFVEAERLCSSLNRLRPDSACCLRANLLDLKELERLAEESLKLWGHLDGLVNNASSFYPTRFSEADGRVWDELMGINLRAPYFLSKTLMPALQRAGGAIVNIADVYGDRPLEGYSIYSITKTGLIGLTKALALELAPGVRVNAVSPGAILWHEHPTTEEERRRVLDRIPLGRLGAPEDIARAVRYLLLDATYVTGQIHPVDGGRMLTI